MCRDCRSELGRRPASANSTCNAARGSAIAASSVAPSPTGPTPGTICTKAAPTTVRVLAHAVRHMHVSRDRLGRGVESWRFQGAHPAPSVTVQTGPRTYGLSSPYCPEESVPNRPKLDGVFGRWVLSVADSTTLGLLHTFRRVQGSVFVPKAAQTKWHEASFGGSLWHEWAGRSVYQLPDQPIGRH